MKVKDGKEAKRPHTCKHIIGILKLPTVLRRKVNAICGKYCIHPSKTLPIPNVAAHTLTAVSDGCSLPPPDSGPEDVGGEVGRVERRMMVRREERKRCSEVRRKRDRERRYSGERETVECRPSAPGRRTDRGSKEELLVASEAAEEAEDRRGGCC